MKDIEYWKQQAREANARGDYHAVGMLIVDHLSELFGDNHKAAHAFFRELEKTAPMPMYEPMRGD